MDDTVDHKAALLQALLLLRESLPMALVLLQRGSVSIRDQNNFWMTMQAFENGVCSALDYGTVTIDAGLNALIDSL